MKLYQEWCINPMSRHGCMLPVTRIRDMEKAPDSGYASLYCFDEDAAMEVLASKSSAGLSRFPVYTDRLVIDLDEGSRQLKKALDAIVGMGLTYQVWSSGGKGFHLIFKLDMPVGGRNVPYSQRKWVEALGIGADLSLYQHGRILSLPGRVHPKTGCRKALHMDWTSGKPLNVPEVQAPQPTFTSLNEGGDLVEGLFQLYSLAGPGPEPGNRHTKLWSTAERLAQAGLSYDTVVDLLLVVNSQWTNPKEDAAVRLAAAQGFRESPGRRITSGPK